MSNSPILVILLQKIIIIELKKIKRKYKNQRETSTDHKINVNNNNMT